MRKSGKIKLSIIVVYFGEWENIKRLLKSIYNNKIESTYEIIIVNNKVGDKIAWKLKGYKKLRVVESGVDLGYGRGNNLGVKNASGKFVLIVNPDTEILPNSIEKLVKFLENDYDTAIVAPNLRYPEGGLIEYAGTKMLTPLRGIFVLSILNKIFPDNSVSRDYYMFDTDKNAIREVDVISGSAFMIRMSVFRKMGGFDDNFFMYFEETDLCKRIKENGWKIFICPEAEVIHDWKPAEQNQYKKVFKESRFYYFRKHYGIFSALIVEYFARLSKKSIYFFFFILILIGLIKIST